MDFILHYTSKIFFKKIKQSGLLLPKTCPGYNPENYSEELKEIIVFDKYLVGIDPNSKEAWDSSGLLDYLIRYTSGEVSLNVPILNKNNVFVREHFHLSPENFFNLHGENLWKRAYLGEIEKDDKRFYDAVNSYLNSSVLLNNYKGNYKVPELWLHQKTPLELIDVMK